MSRVKKIGEKSTQGKRSVEEKDESYLPLDIIQIILSKLPVKTLLRFKTVSKPWTSMISDPAFAKTHLYQSKRSESKNHLLLRSSKFSEGHQTTFEDGGFQPISAVELPFKKYEWVDILCSCEGLVLLNFFDIYLIWNPSTRVYREFRCSYVDANTIRLGATHGLCYNPSRGEYKMVMVWKNQYAIFSFESGSKKKKDFSYSGITRSPCVCFAGMLFWVVIQRERNYGVGVNVQYPEGRFLEYNPGNIIGFESDPTCAHEIVNFDPMDDKFKKFERPNGVEKEFYLTTLSGSLCVYQSWFNGTFIQRWTTKEGICGNSWMKLLSIDDIPLFVVCRHIHPLWWTKENQFVFYAEKSEKFIVFTPTTNVLKIVNKFWPKEIKYSSMITYVDSLATPLLKARPNRNVRKVNGG